MTLTSLPNPPVKMALLEFGFHKSPEKKHTATCNGADELAYGNLGRCLGSL